jgi:hypothetical protein
VCAGAGGVFLLAGCSMRLEMERWFFVEAKTFVLSVMEGASVLQVEERRS